MSRRERRAAEATARKAGGPLPSGAAALIARLRQATIDAVDFARPWKMFCDELTAWPGFVSAGVRAESALVARGVELGVRRVVPESQVIAMTLKRVEGGFMHGYAHTSVGLAGVYYFEQGDIGLMAFAHGGLTHLLRISSVEVPSPFSGPSRDASAGEPS